MELFALFWIQYKVVGQRIKIDHCDEKDKEVVGLKNGEAKIQDFEFVKVIEEHFQISMSSLPVDHGACKVQIMLFFCSICNLGEVGVQGRVANHPQLHNKI